MRRATAALLLALLAAAAPAAARDVEADLGPAAILRAAREPHPYGPQLRKAVLATMGPGTMWGRYRDPDDGRRYLGAEGCRPCHGDRHQGWADTKMATAIKKLADFRGGLFLNDSRCLSCHTTGYDPGRDNGGFDDGVDPLAGVQCEACHGAGSLMVERLDRAYIVRSTEADLCGRCHAERYGTGLCFPEHDEWKVSRHAASLETVKRSPYASSSCLGCHSVEGIVPPSDRAVTVESAAAGVTCQACHDAMSRTFPELVDNNQLRRPKAELCQWCHSAREPYPDGLPHAPQGDLFAGRGGAEFPGESYPRGAMNAELPRGCLSCHGTSDRSVERPWQGHAFMPDIRACRRCHPDLQTFDRKRVQTGIRSLLLELEARLRDYPAGAPKGESHRRALHNYTFVLRDRSLGIHNTDYARKLLVDSIRFLGKDAPPSPSAVEGSPLP